MSATFTSKIAFLDKLNMAYLTVTDECLRELLRVEDPLLYNQRFHVTVNDTVTWQAGTVSLGNNAAYITFSKARMKTVGVDVGDTVTVFLEKDTSEYGFDVPIEFEEVLRQDEVANARFLSLPKGARRGIIYLVLQIKSSDKRIEKSIFYLENLKRAPEGKITMRHLLGKEIP